jgi:hypothetical protein
MTDKIPFVISEACPDYKRPSIVQQFGTCYKSEIPYYFVNKVAEFIFERSDPDAVNDIEGIEYFWKQYYSDYYIDNPPWEANAFIDNKWVNITPTDEEILERIQKLILFETEDIERDCDKQAELSYEEENLYQLSNEDKLVIDKMKEYFEKEGLQVSESEDPNQQVISTLNKFILNTNIEKFNENKELLNNFINTMTRCIEKDIEKITSDLEVIHNEENSQRLKQIMVLYGSLLEYKNNYKF